MSNFYLCDCCRHWLKWRPNHTGLEGRCTVTEESGSLFRKKVMYDYHGAGGKRYDRPTDVCKYYEPEVDV